MSQVTPFKYFSGIVKFSPFLLYFMGSFKAKIYEFVKKLIKINQKKKTSDILKLTLSVIVYASITKINR